MGHSYNSVILYLAEDWILDFVGNEGEGILVGSGNSNLHCIRRK